MPRLSAQTKPLAAVPDQPELEPVAETKPPPRARTKPAAEAATLVDDGWGFHTLDEAPEYLNVLLYGREGSGKTTAAATMANLAPAGSKVLVINAEGGLKKLALQRRGVDTSKIVLWPAPGTRVTFPALEKLHEKLLADLMANPGYWYGMSLDSITEVVASLREQATDKRVEKLRRNLTASEMASVDEDFIDRDDFGVMTNQMRQLIRRFRDLPCHVVITALERVDDKTGMTGPAITPALATDVMGYVDLVLACRASLHATGEDEDAPLAEFRALTRPGKATRAKDRFDLTPRVLADPSFIRIHGYVTGQLDEQADPIQAAFNRRRAEEAAAAAEAEAEREQRKAAAKSTTTKKAPAKAAGAKATETEQE